MSDPHILAGLIRPILFLKATVRRRVFIPTFTRGNGSVVQGHYAMVHVADDHDDARLLSGQGSHSQRQAHARLTREAWYNALPADHRVPVLLKHATGIQDAATQSAALSGWRTRAHAGQNPTNAQWQAYAALPGDRQVAMMRAATSARGNASHLRPPATPIVAVSSATPAARQVAAPRLVGAVEVAAHPVAPVNREDAMAAMAAVPVPVFPDTSDSNRGTTRRAAELRRVALAGDIDAVANYPTSRTRGNYARVDDYRLALLAAAQHLTAAQASEEMRRPIPHPPEITGANMQNTALLAARRKCMMLLAATGEADPVAALMAVATSRGNRYLNAADDYKRVLLAHFGVNIAGVAVAGASPENPPPATQVRPRVSGRAGQPAESQSLSAPVAVPAASPASASPIPDAQNPAVAANPLGLSEEALGFVPRPNVPLSTRTNQAGFRHADPRVMALNRRYLAQNASLQSRARDYQAGNWRPQTPESIAAQRAQEAARQAAEMAAIRAAAAQVEARMGRIEQVFRPRHVVGANIEGMIVLDEPTRASLQTFFQMPAEQVLTLLRGMVADYDTPGKFTMTVNSHNGDGATVKFSKPDGTQITRNFTRSGADLKVYHAYFKAGRTGHGSGKHLFRCSMGVYKALGVTEVGVTANIDVGGYAWARFGYKPRSWSGLQSELRGRLQVLARGDLRLEVTTERADGRQGRERRHVGALTPAQVARVKAVLDANSATALWALADMRIGERQVGKELLLGTCWSGAMSLNDAAVMRRFTRYVQPEEGGRNA